MGPLSETDSLWQAGVSEESIPETLRLDRPALPDAQLCGSAARGGNIGSTLISEDCFILSFHSSFVNSLLLLLVCYIAAIYNSTDSPPALTDIETMDPEHNV